MSSALYRLRIAPNVGALISGLHPQLKKKVRRALEHILADPRCGKALKQELAGLWSYRVSRFRIIYRIGAGRTVELVALGPRERIYEETYRLIAKGVE